MNRAIREFVLLSGLSAMLIFLAYLLGLPPNLLHASLFAFLAFAGFTFLILLMHLMLDKRIAKAIITSSMIAVIFVRLFLTIAVILFYYEFYRPDGDAFVIPFFIFYLIYMVFENRFLINYSKEIEQG